jgi:hypothetical protein
MREPRKIDFSGGRFFSNIHQATYKNDLIIVQSKKAWSTFFLFPYQMFQKGNQFEKGFCLEPARRQAERVMNRRISPVRTVTRDSEIAELGPAQNQSVDARSTLLTDYFELSDLEGDETDDGLRPIPKSNCGPVQFALTVQIAHRRVISRHRFLTSRHFYNRVDLDDVANELSGLQMDVGQAGNPIEETFGKPGVSKGIWGTLSQPA